MHLKLSFVAVLGSLVGLSQPMTEQLDRDYVITNWRAEEGLPESSATDMVQTSDGYLWFGTFNGLVRFDGSRFTVFGPSNVPAIPHSGIIKLTIDRRGRMWVGTLGGIVLYSEGRWQRVDTPKGWTGFVNDFAEFSSGSLCVKSSTRNVFCSDGDRVTALPDPAPINSTNRDARLLFDAEGVLHVGYDGGLLRFRDGRWEAAPTPTGLATGPSAPRLFWGRAPDGNWFALQGNRLSKVTRDSVRWTRKLPSSYASVGQLTESRDGAVWLVSDSEGLIRADAEGSVRILTKGTGLTSNSFRFVFVDRDGNHWAGSNGAGLFLLRPRTFASVGLDAGLPDFPVKSVALDANGDLLAATYGGGLQRQSQGRFRRIADLNAVYTQTVLVDRTKRVWAGSYMGGLWMSSGGPFKQQPLASTGGGIIEALFEDSKGALWIGANNSAAVFENGAYRQVEVIEKKEPVIVDCFAEDLRTHTIWAGGDGGLYRYEAGQLRPVKDQTGDALPSVRAISVNDDGALWIGTSDSGLLRWKDGVVNKIPMPMGFHGGIGAILRHWDHLWLATSRGVWRVGRKNLEAAAESGNIDGAWRHFGREDGMPSFESPIGHQPSAILAANGTILFPTLKGVAVLDPTKAPAARTAEVLFESVHFRDESGQETTVDIARGRPVQLPPDGHDVEVFYTSMSGGTPSRVLFDYELWNGRQLIASGRLGQRQLRLHRLLAGENTLRLRATNAAGVWSHVWNDLVIERQPRIWERWQSQLGAGLLALLVAFWSVRGVLAKRAREHEQKVAHMAELQQTLLKAKEHAVESARAKGEFLANMSHEIRTPLNGVLGAGKLLEMTPVNAEQRELLNTMIESGELLRRLLSDILDVSQIEAGSLVLQPEVFSFHEMIAETARLVRPEAERKNLQFQVTIASEIPTCVLSDKTRIEQIVINYLNNAIKFTDAGAVDLSVLLLEREEKQLTLQIRVSDTGVGIPAAKHSIVFDAFEQADSSSTRRKGGCGLGLSIVKRLAALLGGSVGMESRLGFGSTFWANIVVTAATVPETPSAPESASPYSAEIANLKILVAEDNRVNQMITRRMLNRLGCTNIDIAENGNQVLGKAGETAYDMILMDVHMPELDGIEATRAIRTGQRQTPIIALTASVLDADRVRCREAGMDDFVPKPVELHELRRVIESVLAGRAR